MKKIFTLIAITMVAVCANAQTLVSFGGSDANKGYEVSGTTTETVVKIHTNADEVACLKLANGYSSDNVANGNDIKLTTDGGFKAGDVVSLAGAVSIKESDVASKRAGAVVFTKDAEGVCTKLHTFSDFINGRLGNDEPVVETYTLETDADVLYIGRDGNTGACVTYLTVVRGGGDTPAGETWTAVLYEGFYGPMQDDDSYPTVFEYEGQATLTCNGNGTYTVKNYLNNKDKSFTFSINADGSILISDPAQDSWGYNNLYTGNSDWFCVSLYSNTYNGYYYSWTYDAKGNYYVTKLDEAKGEVGVNGTAFNSADSSGNSDIWGYYSFAWDKEYTATSINSVKTSTGSSVIYDLQGRKLNAAPAKGMYIKNGKKYMAK